MHCDPDSLFWTHCDGGQQLERNLARSQTEGQAAEEVHDANLGFQQSQAAAQTRPCSITCIEIGSVRAATWISLRQAEAAAGIVADKMG